MPSTRLELAYGSKVSLKNTARSGGLLHSHVQRFPSGSEQQQITTYSHKDGNNEWIVEKGWGSPRRNEDDPIEFVLDGDIVRLVHDATKKNLHSHNVKAPLTESEYEVSGYGEGYTNDTSLHDPNDNWIIQRIDVSYHSLQSLVSYLLSHFSSRTLLWGKAKDLGL